MTSTQPHIAQNLAAPMTRTETHALVMLTLGQVVIFLIPLVVLGQAIGWPASLRLPASEALPLIAGKAIFVQIGYWGYLLTAVAMVPFVIALRRLASAHGAGGLLADTMAAFGVAAAVLKTLGIVRWLIGMPALADLYANTSDPVVRVMFEVCYLTHHSNAGGSGGVVGSGPGRRGQSGAGYPSGPPLRVPSGHGRGGAKIGPVRRSNANVVRPAVGEPAAGRDP